MIRCCVARKALAASQRQVGQLRFGPPKSESEEVPTSAPKIHAQRSVTRLLGRLYLFLANGRPSLETGSLDALTWASPAFRSKRFAFHTGQYVGACCLSSADA